MARGKSASKSANRRLRQLVAKAAALRAEIAAEHDTIDEIRTEVEATARLRADLRTATEARTRDTAAEATALRAEADLLNKLLLVHRDHEKAIRHQWERVTDQAVKQHGGGREGFEWFMGACGQGGFLVDDDRLSSSRATRLQKIRGDRKCLPTDATKDWAEHNEAAGYLTLLRPHYVRKWHRVGLTEDVEVDLARADLTPEQRDVYEATKRAVRGLLGCQPSSVDADSVRAWHPLPWVVSPTPSVQSASGFADDAVDGEISRALGAVWRYRAPSPDASPTATAAPGGEWPTPTPALSAATRKRLATTSPETLTEKWRDGLAAGEALARILGSAHSSLRAGPRHPRPGRAASLRHLYAKAAIGAWVRDQDEQRDAEPAAGSTEQLAAGDPTTWAEVAVALTVASPFWLPGGQTYTFANSEPLGRDDLKELLLPFPQVFLAFAEPIIIEPHRPPTARETTVISDLDQANALLRRKTPGFRDLLSSVRDIDHLWTLELDTVLDIRGAAIEGVLVLADSLGRLEDAFAWCVRIPSGADGTLGRHVIPANLTTTKHRHLVENLIAVAAWAEWHAPDADTDIPPGRSPEALFELMNTPHFKRDADRSGGGGVRVLNVRATNRHSDSSAGGLPTAHVAPHVRRGHWRRQRFGTGSKQLKRIRIAPVIVNAHRGALTERVYVLPRESR
jgi:hypothetical protein